MGGMLQVHEAAVGAHDNSPKFRIGHTQPENSRSSGQNLYLLLGRPVARAKVYWSHASRNVKRYLQSDRFPPAEFGYSNHVGRMSRELDGEVTWQRGTN